jgi:hypothetical protein
MKDGGIRVPTKLVFATAYMPEEIGVLKMDKSRLRTRVT